MPKTTVRYISFPKTEPPPPFAVKLAAVFRGCEDVVGTRLLSKGLTSNEVLAVIRGELVQLGFQVEAGKQREDKIQRPVFFGENGEPTLRFEIDAYHPDWRCGLEVEAGRAWMGNAIYRDLIQGLVMVQVDTLALAVPNSYKYTSGGRQIAGNDYENSVHVAETLYGHSRVRMPYRLIIIGY